MKERNGQLETLVLGVLSVCVLSINASWLNVKLRIVSAAFLQDGRKGFACHGNSFGLEGDNAFYKGLCFCFVCLSARTVHIWICLHFAYVHYRSVQIWLQIMYLIIGTWVVNSGFLLWYLLTLCDTGGFWKPAMLMESLTGGKLRLMTQSQTAEQQPNDSVFPCEVIVCKA